MRRLLVIVLGCVLWMSSHAQTVDGDRAAETATASVLPVRAHAKNGSIGHGSGVLIADGKLVTNCHVVAAADRINVLSNGVPLAARLQHRDTDRDLCLLDVPDAKGVVAQRASTLRAGEAVYAVGYPAQRALSVTRGEVVALHDYDGAAVIQVSAPFDRGASGGGLFDQQGRLVGILTFKARAGGLYHFAVPAAWLNDMREDRPGAEARPFWQRHGRELPYFLRAASLEAAANWNALAELGREWLQQEPANPGAWSALTKARLRSALRTAPDITASAALTLN